MKDTEENDTVYLYWRRCLGYDAVYLYWYEGGSKSSRKSAAKFVIVFGNLRSLCIL